MSERTDSERLDWLETQRIYAMPVQDPATGRWYIYHIDDTFDVNAETLRQVITLAMDTEEAAK